MPHHTYCCYILHTLLARNSVTMKRTASMASIDMLLAIYCCRFLTATEQSACSSVTMKRAASMASMQSIDEDEMSTEARQCLTALREGKRCDILF